MQQLRNPPFHERTSALCKPQIKVVNKDRDAQAGSIVYVAKNVEHCFHSIEAERRIEPVEMLTVIVFFAPAEYSNRG